MEGIRAFLDRYLPAVGLLVGLYFGYDLYTFFTDPASELVVRKAQVKAGEEANQQMQTQVKQAEEFFKTLEAKRMELRGLAQQLNEMKVTLSSDIDVPALIKMITYEAQRVGLRVSSIKPGVTNKKELFAESAFDLDFRGVYAQLVIFMQRLAHSQRLLKIESFSIEPASTLNPSPSASSKYVELRGTLQILAYSYNPSKADDIATKATGAGTAKPEGTP